MRHEFPIIYLLAIFYIFAAKVTMIDNRSLNKKDKQTRNVRVLFLEVNSRIKIS